jgi:hypothetical protein
MKVSSGSVDSLIGASEDEVDCRRADVSKVVMDSELRWAVDIASVETKEEKTSH